MKATKTTVASVLFSSVLSLSSAHAQLLIYEPFDYEATGEIDDDDAFFGDGNQAGGFGLSFADVVSSEVSTSVTPEISSFTSLGGGAWQLALSGQPEGNYEIFSSPTLPFDPPVLVEDLTQGDPADPGTLGGANNSRVTLDEEGVGLVQIDLGDAPRTFLRIQTVLAPGGG